MRNCIVCNKRFVPVNKKHVCCSKSCRVNAEYIKINAVCLVFYCSCIICGKLFLSQSKHSGFCSDICRKIRYSNKPKEYQHTCDVCGKTFKNNQPNTKRCSPECAKIFEKSRYSVARKSCDNNKTQQIKCRMPLVFNDIPLRNEGILSRPANTWHRKGFTNGLKEEIKKRDGWQCYACGKETNLHVHHIIPRIEGGGHTPDNLVTLCGGCHRSIESGNTEKAIEKCVARAMNNV